MAQPQISPARCLLALFAVSGCSACVSACPHDALCDKDDGLHLESARCSGCGGCAAAGPVQAITLDGQEAPVPLDRPRAQGWLMCPRMPGATPATALCLRNLGLSGLAELWLLGLRQISCLTADCATCPEAADHTFDAARQLNALLVSRDLPGLRLVHAQRSPTKAVQIGPQKGPQNPSRRQILALATGPKPPPLARLQSNTDPKAALYAFTPQINAQLCTGCNACLHACPQASLSLIKAPNGEIWYQAHGFSCNGCNLCADMCSIGAITIERAKPAPDPVPLVALTCKSCGVSAHVPQNGPYAGTQICPTCQKTCHLKPHRQVLT